MCTQMYRCVDTEAQTDTNTHLAFPPFVSPAPTPAALSAVPSPLACPELSPESSLLAYNAPARDKVDGTLTADPVHLP